MLEGTKAAIHKAAELYERLIKSIRYLAGFKVWGPLPRVITPEWLLSHYGDPRLFYWRVDPMDFTFLGKTVMAKLGNFALSVGLNEALVRWMPGPGEGSPSDAFEFTDLYQPNVYVQQLFVLSKNRLRLAGYVLANGVLIQETYLKQKRQERANMIHSTSSSSQLYSEVVIPTIIKVCQEQGLNAALCVGQVNLESGYGRHVPPGSHNYTGIKARVGDPFVESLTNEFDRASGRMKRVVQRFRKFESPQAFAEYYVNWLANTTSNRFYKEAVRNPDNVKAAKLMAKGGYATDPAYSSKLARFANEAEKSLGLSHG